ncbi:tyrosine-type recombinase/integrase [Massilia sp. YIM B02763]|uniref:tyrosine-type recombinase/integrase n=1 Tax=Massilia sp. YIM B02763 TaxID=3050130 RepID=UPI0025B6A702|nr:tyrosine-type recombinase/integrase [Massilia sp. YIM B02763]MDN4053125.1 tyrosine-type recombinase/integrase [Massilia sp. YIM B02763]
MSTELLPLRIRPIRWRNGERFAMLINANTGMPLLVPTVFAVATLRQKDLSFSAISQAMYAVRILIHYTYVMGIDLWMRIHVEGKLLDLNEVEKIGSLCRLHNGALENELRLMLTTVTSAPKKSNVIDMYQARPKKKKVAHVDRGTTNIRLTHIHNYLKWISDREIIKMADGRSNYQDVRDNIGLCLSALKAKKTKDRDRNTVNVRKKGLSEDVISRIHEVVDPESDENPWRPGFNRYRNRLYIYWLLELSLRRGEALGVLLEDLDVADEKVQVMRRPDNPKDPRGKYAPLTKTRDRILKVSGPLLEYTEEYLAMRRKFSNADRHGYLFISSWHGDPISISAARDIFNGLREKVPGLPNLSAQILRHTWNTLFTKHAYKTKMSDKKRLESMRNQNGWSDESMMPDYYSIAAIEEEAQNVSLEVQNKIHGLKKEEKNGKPI